MYSLSEDLSRNGYFVSDELSTGYNLFHLSRPPPPPPPPPPILRTWAQKVPFFYKSRTRGRSSKRPPSSAKYVTRVRPPSVPDCPPPPSPGINPPQLSIIGIKIQIGPPLKEVLGGQYNYREGEGKCCGRALKAARGVEIVSVVTIRAPKK